MVYAEWGIFTVLVVALIALWWILQFGIFQDKGGSGQSVTIPEQVVNNLMAGTSTPQPVPAIVIRNLSSSVSTEGGKPTDSLKPGTNQTASTEPVAPPQEAINFLTAQR